MKALASVVGAVLVVVVCAVPGIGQETETRLPVSKQMNQPCLDSSAVTVQKVTSVLPTNKQRLETFLLDNFANGPHEAQFHCPAAGATELVMPFSQSLVGKANALALDGSSLGKCLSVVEAGRGKSLVLPVAAFRMTYKGAPAWIIVAKWEWGEASSSEVLEHVCVYAFEANRTRKIGYVTSN